MIPILLCAYKPRYLDVVLEWLKSMGDHRGYRIFAWDNGGAAEQLRHAGLEWHCVRDEQTQDVLNLGKALAMRYLMDVVNAAMPDADCYVLMDDDIVVDSDQLDAMAAAARRPALGMIGPRYHPFNTPMPSGGTVTFMDRCPSCKGVPRRMFAFATCRACGGTGVDEKGLRLRTYPVEDRTLRNIGRIAGGVFAVSKASLGKLEWAPHPYPLVLDDDGKPVVYWSEDAVLDLALTKAGLTNGYLEGNDYTPVIHLPDLNQAYREWKRRALRVPPTSDFQSEAVNRA